MNSEDPDELDLDGMLQSKPTLVCKGRPNCELSGKAMEAAIASGCRICHIIVFTGPDQILPTEFDRIH